MLTLTGIAKNQNRFLIDLIKINQQLTSIFTIFCTILYYYCDNGFIRITER